MLLAELGFDPIPMPVPENLPAGPAPAPGPSPRPNKHPRDDDDHLAAANNKRQCLDRDQPALFPDFDAPPAATTGFNWLSDMLPPDVISPFSSDAPMSPPFGALSPLEGASEEPAGAASPDYASRFVDPDHLAVFLPQNSVPGAVFAPSSAVPSQTQHHAPDAERDRLGVQDVAEAAAMVALRDEGTLVQLDSIAPPLDDAAAAAAAPSAIQPPPTPGVPARDPELYYNRIGLAFQASLPEHSPAPPEPLQDKSTPLYRPSLPEDAVNEYLDLLSEVVIGRQQFSQLSALEALHDADYDTKRALEAVLASDTLGRLPRDSWTPVQRLEFDLLFKKHGKDFPAIYRALQATTDKTHQEVVWFYYRRKLERKATQYYPYSRRAPFAQSPVRTDSIFDESQQL